jgi:hypothetical protein
MIGMLELLTTYMFFALLTTYMFFAIALLVILPYLWFESVKYTQGHINLTSSYHFIAYKLGAVCIPKRVVFEPAFLKSKISLGCAADPFDSQISLGVGRILVRDDKTDHSLKREIGWRHGVAMAASARGR